jgi:hypothetical protein
MDDLKSFSAVVALYTSLADLAEDAGVGQECAKKWKQRDSIPACHWQKVADGARRRGYAQVTMDLLIHLGRQRSRAVDVLIDLATSSPAQ